MNGPMTKEIDVEDYPDIDPDTQDGQEEFSCLACELKRQSNGLLTHFIFKRKGEMIGEMYVTNAFEEKQ